ncbi:hypothetical protein PSQ53_06810 [Limosilactobacillus reuteri]|uniref:Uncharacterized protein n=1 Tax=Limosilactobacillus reuteri TaxID=1598 RepID=A0AAW6JEY9_LIMRT|nr:hypothetical protein [Limosilactobacillus reuteri]MDY4500839.1 hypothetical protein [Lactobacillus johnsonii]PEG89667.1 hypothetical protein CP364_00465 [Lactobacillus sp. UMNPBX13]PEH01184.1 hypothetical protein CP358_02420 [Lactobacillus sp. UMNPBX7]MDD1382651.1 hypothetical protein [Limosilactobacillus reuteri]MDD1399751.1 hypothetical protein [Limosilactobacillus reuteri]
MTGSKEFIRSMTLSTKRLSKEALKFDEKNKEYKFYHRTLSEMWNLIGNNGILLNPIRYSVKAQKIFTTSKLRKQGFQSLSELKWDEWRKLKGQDEFLLLNDLMWEHAYTRSDFASDAIEIVRYGKNVNDKLGELIKKHQIIWITREENKCLTKHGYRSHRPNGWETAYEECEIELV